MQLYEFTYCNDKYSKIAMTHKHDKYDIIIPHLQRLGWTTLPPIIITVGMRVPFTNRQSHTSFIWKSLTLEIRIKTQMETISLNAIKYLTHMVLNKSKLEEHQTPFPCSKNPHYSRPPGSTYWEISITPSPSYIA